MDVYSGALYIVARLTRHSRGKTWLQNRILDTAALRAHAYEYVFRVRTLPRCPDFRCQEHACKVHACKVHAKDKKIRAGFGVLLQWFYL